MAIIPPEIAELLKHVDVSKLGPEEKRRLKARLQELEAQLNKMQEVRDAIRKLISDM